MTEIELKFLVDEVTAKHLRARAAKLAGARVPSRVKTLTSIYYDTPSHDLAANGIAVRLRREGRRWRQTVKARLRPAGGLQIAEEVDLPAAGDNLTLDALPNGALARRLAQVTQGTTLEPVCETAISRSRIEIVQEDGSRVAAMFDRGEIRAGDTARPFGELELELVEGSLSALFDAARTLLADGALRFSMLSKPERGVLLAREGRIEPAPSPRKACLVALDPNQTAETAASTVLRESFAQVVHNVDVVLADDTPEGPHQLRVGLRRLRSAMLLFDPVIGHPEAERLNREARWLGQEVGALRDLDVAICDVIAAEAARHPAEPGFARLVAALQARRSACRDQLRGCLAGARARNLLLDLMRFTETRGWLMPEDIEQTARLAAPVRSMAGGALDRRWRAVAKRAKGIERLDLEARHELRKALKKLRYAVEFVGPIYKAKAVARFTKRLKTMQTLFGDLNDAAMAQALLSGPNAPGAGDPAAQRATGLVLGARLAAAEAAWTQAQQMWRDLQRTPKFWA